MKPPSNSSWASWCVGVNKCDLVRQRAITIYQKVASHTIFHHVYSIYVILTSHVQEAQIWTPKYLGDKGAIHLNIFLKPSLTKSSNYIFPYSCIWRCMKSLVFKQIWTYCKNMDFVVASILWVDPSSNFSNA